MGPYTNYVVQKCDFLTVGQSISSNVVFLKMVYKTYIVFWKMVPPCVLKNLVLKNTIVWKTSEIFLDFYWEQNDVVFSWMVGRSLSSNVVFWGLLRNGRSVSFDDVVCVCPLIYSVFQENPDSHSTMKVRIFTIFPVFYSRQSFIRNSLLLQSLQYTNVNISQPTIEMLYF